MAESEKEVGRTQSTPFAVRFSIRTVLVGLTVFCVWLGWNVQTARKQQAIVAKVREHGGTVRYRSRDLGQGLVARTLGRDFRNPVVEVAINEQTDFSFLSGLPRMERLILGGGTITDVASLSDLKQLVHLELGGLPIEDISSVGQLTQLETLVLDGSLVRDISALSGLSRLTVFQAADTSIRDVSAVSGMHAVEELYLGRVPVTDIRPLADLESLKILQLDWTPVEDLSPLEGSRSLGRLSLLATNTRDISVLKSLNNLQTLCIAASPVDDIELLADVPNLRTLFVDSRQMESPAVDELSKQAPQCRIGVGYGGVGWGGTPIEPWLPWQSIPQESVDRIGGLTAEMDLQQTLHSLQLSTESALWTIQLPNRTTIAFKPPNGLLVMFFTTRDGDRERRMFKRAELIGQTNGTSQSN